MTTATICLDVLDEVRPCETVPLEVDVRMPPDANGVVYLKRKRWRTFGEVYMDMHKALYLRVCDKCGHETGDKFDAWRDTTCPKCGGEMQALIDEYDSGPSHLYEDKKHQQIGEVDEHIRQIVCSSHVGSSEGYHAEMGVLLRKPYQDGCRYVALYWVKSFRGMDHVHHLVERMMKATGVWPLWGG